MPEPLDDAPFDRAVGALLGLAVGDAVGTTVEFKRRGSFPPVTDMVGGGPFGLKPGEWTDDTSMALCLADSLVATKGELDPADLMRRFVGWWRRGENSVTGRCFDIGNATQAALRRFEETGESLAGSDDEHSAGNGSIMRLAPAALVALTDENRAAATARLQSETTHAAAECLDASEWLARVLVRAIGGAGEAALSTPFAHGSVAEIARGAWRRKEAADILSSGYVIHTLDASIWAVGTSASFEESVLKAVNLGDDADSVGAVTGQIAGAIWGRSAIPGSWLGRLAWRDGIQARAAHLIALSAGDSERRSVHLEHMGKRLI